MRRYRPALRYAASCFAAAAVLAACRGEQTPVRRAEPPADTALGPAWQGVYEHARNSITFRPCRAAEAFVVRGSDSILQLLDAKLSWHTSRPRTTVWVAVRGNPVAERSGAALVVTAIDSSRDLEPGECAPPRREPPPPPDRRLLDPAVRQALGSDSAAARTAAVGSAYLDADDEAEALVLARSPALCDRPAGCTLLIFRREPQGYGLVSRVRGVSPPVRVVTRTTSGWRNLVVRVGGGAFPSRDVLLFYGARGYPAQAPLQPDVAAAFAAQGRVVLGP